MYFEMLSILASKNIASTNIVVQVFLYIFLKHTFNWKIPPVFLSDLQFFTPTRNVWEFQLFYILIYIWCLCFKIFNILGAIK